MADERVFQQVAGILGIAEISFTTDRVNERFAVRCGSACVYISFAERGESTIVYLRAFLLQQVDGSDERKLKILEALNERNRTIAFGCFYFDSEAGDVIVDHQLLGDQLEAPELLNALQAVCVTSDAADDELRDAIGSGVRAADLLDAPEEGAPDPEGAGLGPVVNT